MIQFVAGESGPVILDAHFDLLVSDSPGGDHHGRVGWRRSQCVLHEVGERLIELDGIDEHREPVGFDRALHRSMVSIDPVEPAATRRHEFGEVVGCLVGFECARLNSRRARAGCRRSDRVGRSRRPPCRGAPTGSWSRNAARRADRWTRDRIVVSGLRRSWETLRRRIARWWSSSSLRPRRRSLRTATPMATAMNVMSTTTSSVRPMRTCPIGRQEGEGVGRARRRRRRPRQRTRLPSSRRCRSARATGAREW